ncbi:trimeric intracellular cation channel family protein [Vibrio ulleungensis]|uniref:Trimeric intracellular cation channel family protein n=1 Tax=Vibrio ulleungensis TaxID=2807619 RepID=A0ABS2HCH1_9VIBR|nr:trimeric intracellular cation channel family protein [Vibrio ulleungensis]MBM7034781.1 trimeric intracellular cation channel family protein [Vibrio ulleungensis]
MFITTAELITSISILGTAAFAFSAVLAASEKNTDIFTVAVLGVITAVGGGSTRDVLLNTTVFWSEEMYYIWIAITSSLIGFLSVSLLKKNLVYTVNLYVDAIAISMFAIQGTDKAWSLGFGLPLGPIMLGIITAVGGGVIRDILLQRPTLLLSKELYAIPVALGCTLHALGLTFAPQYSDISAIVSALLVFYLRHLSISKQVQVPRWALISTGKS